MLRTLRSLIVLFSVSTIYAQTPFPGFTAGNLVLSRSVYMGDATTLVVGQSLPPICPATAACGAPATNSGAYPSAASGNNVWNNDAVD